jgi:predicted enzyme related to lactoylglutathione lyase
MSDDVRFTHSGLQLAVKDVEAAVDFYHDVLGFEVDYADGHPVEYAVIYRDDVYIHLCRRKDQEFDLGPGCGFVVVSGVQELWPRIQASRVEVIHPLRRSDYGHGVVFMDFAVWDLDKNVLRIGEPLSDNVVARDARTTDQQHNRPLK